MVLTLWPPEHLGSGVLVCMDLDIEFWVFVEAVEVCRSSEVLHSQHGNVLLVPVSYTHLTLPTILLV